jgi:hypothetical protein
LASIGHTTQVVGQHVELLLCLALDVRPARGTEHPAERALGNPLGDCFARERDVEDQAVEVPARARMAPPLLDEELRERRTVGEHGSPS